MELNMHKQIGLLFGVIFVAVGILGFVPGITRNEHLLGIFHVNAAHNVVHILTGLFALMTGFTGEHAATMFFRLFGVIYGLVAALGFVYGDQPILGLILNLEMPMVREILSQHEFRLDQDSNASAMAVGISSTDLLDACIRLITLLDQPQDIPFLAPLIQREIIFRLLRSPQGKHLRAIATLGEQTHRTAKAVEWLRTNYAKPLRVEDLATMARMGVSTLHHQFRSLTAMSPLQYQKQLRLHVARERMLNGGIDAASAAFEVGYESASQFNREYSRFFGQPPMRDIKSRRLTTSVSE